MLDLWFSSVSLLSMIWLRVQTFLDGLSTYPRLVSCPSLRYLGVSPVPVQNAKIHIVNTSLLAGFLWKCAFEPANKQTSKQGRYRALGMVWRVTCIL